ncbi:MAG: hypothetical protein FWD54_06165 [Endomicrobia bacterium]|nr:hypothetical protein [Endomicrobiia bacterium]
MDILARDKQEKEEVLKSEKYMRVKARASQLLDRDITLRLIGPENMTMYGNYNARTLQYRSEKDIKILVPYNAKTLDLPEDSLLAFVLSEYFYLYKEEPFFLADQHSVELTGNAGALIKALKSFQDNSDGLHSDTESVLQLLKSSRSISLDGEKEFLQDRINELMKLGYAPPEPESENNLETEFNEEYSEKPVYDILPKPKPKIEKPPVYDMLKERNKYGLDLGSSKMSGDIVFTKPVINSSSAPVSLYVILIIAAAALLFWGVNKNVFNLSEHNIEAENSINESEEAVVKNSVISTLKKSLFLGKSDKKTDKIEKLDDETQQNNETGEIE